MPVTPDEVRRAAELARLDLSDLEIQRLVRHLGDVLRHVEELRGAEERAGTEGDRSLEPRAGIPAAGIRAVPVASLRSDEPGGDSLTRRVSDFAPGFSHGFFTVPRLASHGAVEGPDSEIGPGEPPDASGATERG